MVLKDWKKVSERTKKIVWKNKNLEIILGQTYEGFWIVIINNKFKKSFNSKPQALKYTKEYMRKH